MVNVSPFHVVNVAPSPGHSLLPAVLDRAAAGG